MKRVVVPFLFVFFFVTPYTSFGLTGLLQVSDLAITTRVVKGKPVDSVRSISSATARELYCFSSITAADDEERTVTHVWYRNGEVLGSFQLPVKGRRWRTYSKKFIDKGMPGTWRVEVQDAAGNVLHSIEFAVN